MLNPNNHTLHEALTAVGAVQTREDLQKNVNS